MTDAPFVLASYAIVLGSVIGYAVMLARRTAAAAVAERAIRRELDER
jgi:hypothetical protein